MSKAKISSLFEYYFVICLKFLLSLLPVFLFYKLAFLFANFVYFIFPISFKRTLLSRLEIAFGVGAVGLRSLSRSVFVHSFYSLFEMVTFPKLAGLDFDARISFSDYSINVIKELMSRGRGVVLVSGHYGNWEYLGKAVASLGYPVNVVYRPLDNSYLNNYVNANRLSYSSGLISRDEVYYRGLDVLARNEILILLMDQHQAVNGIDVSFFGKRVSTARGPALLSYRTGAPIMFAWIERNADLLTHRVSFEEMDYFSNLSYDDFVFRSTESFTLFLEGVVRDKPEEWWWFHSRWRD